MTTLGKYELHEQLGRGGFGTVYRAIDTSLNREVALKVLHPQLTTDPDFLERFRNEARLVASLRSPNIVTIHDLGEVDGRVFIAMEYLSGGSLKQKLEKEGAIPFGETLEIIRQVCSGLSVAHEQGLVHRDIKPGNILFDNKGNAVLADFGLARAMQQSSLSAASSTGGVGTPAYRAPELWLGKPPASPATDIYSLGCVLTEMLTGKVLFDGDSTDVVITQHLVEGPHLSDELPSGIQIILKNTLAKNPNDRYQKVEEFKAAFLEFSDPIENQRISQKVEPLISENRIDEKRKPNNSISENRKVPDIGYGTKNLKPSIFNIKNPKTKLIKEIGLAFCGFVLLIILIGYVSGWFKANVPSNEQIATSTKTETKAIEISSTINPTTPTVAQTEKPTVTATITPDLSVVPEYAAGTIKISSTDNMPMVYIPAGVFMMGSPEGVGDDGEHPEHEVFLSNYWIDQTEVTNGMFKLCVAQGGCVSPEYTSSSTRNNYYGNPEYDNYPVINVHWNAARQYCRWAGRTLPTEAQWEKAAKGNEGYSYPWGNNSPDKNLANYDSNVGDTTEVGSYPEGASPFGVLDMAGNVEEWVWDKFNYYPSELVSDPMYNEGGGGRVMRGGSWYFIEDLERTASRAARDPVDLYNFLGFRCALSGSVSP